MMDGIRRHTNKSAYRRVLLCGMPGHTVIPADSLAGIQPGALTGFPLVFSGNDHAWG
jgi:hypothetical protein